MSYKLKVLGVGLLFLIMLFVPYWGSEVVVVLMVGIVLAYIMIS